MANRTPTSKVDFVSDLLSAIADDIKEYEELCEKYKEKPEMQGGSPNPYGNHCRRLQERLEKDRISPLRRKKDKERKSLTIRGLRQTRHA